MFRPQRQWRAARTPGIMPVMASAHPPSTPRPGRLAAALVIVLSACATTEEPEGARVRFDGKTYLLGDNISRSRGEEGGVVVLWPRIIPAGERDSLRPTAQALQERLRAMVASALPGRPIDVRPENERVCPITGCLGSAVGLLLVRQGTGCVAITLLSDPGKSAQRLVGWAGGYTSPAEVPFREPPESSVLVRDYVPCERLLELTGARDDAVRGALR